MPASSPNSCSSHKTSQERRVRILSVSSLKNAPVLNSRTVRYGEKRNPKDKRPLLRPIICICNDVNAASLAKLRPHAYTIRVQRPADIHIVKRLREICELEGLKTESRALTTLVGVAKGDLRGCLNTLQVDDYALVERFSTI
jgi:hypothetical protein